MFRAARLRRIAHIFVGGGAAISGGYALLIVAKTAPVRHLKFTSTSQNPPEFMQSPSCALANPRKHTAFTETIRVAVEVPPGSPLEKLSDEQVLARVIKGYLGGKIVAPERWALWAADADIARFQGVSVEP
jgi:hypothetical protein